MLRPLYHIPIQTRSQLSSEILTSTTIAVLGLYRATITSVSDFLLTKAHDKTLIAKTREVTRWLLSKERDIDYIVYVENTMKENKIFDAAGIVAEDPESFGSRLKYWDNDLARHRPHTFDFGSACGLPMAGPC